MSWRARKETIVLWGGRSRQGSPPAFRRSTQCCYCPQGSGRSAGGSARDWGWMGRWWSRDEPLRLFLDALVVNDEEETLLSSIPHIRRKNNSLVQYQTNSFFQWERFLVKSQQVLFFVVLLLPSIGMQNLLHSVLTQILRTDLREFLFHCCSNSSQTYSIHEKFWPKSECCLCSKT